MQRFLREIPDQKMAYPVIGKNSEVFAPADPVCIDSSGWADVLTTPGTTTQVYGIAIANETMAAANQTTGGKVCPQLIYPTNVEVIYGSDTDCVQTDIGAKAHFTAGSATGAFVVDLLAGGDGPVMVAGFDPYNESDNDAVVVVFAEPQYLGFVQA